MSRFLADENFPGASIQLLRSAGHDVAAVIEDTPGAEDIEVLLQAVQSQRIILTFDRDYGQLIFGRRLPAPLGVVYFRIDDAHPDEAARMLLLLLALDVIGLEGKFTTIEERQLRQRPLP